MTVTLLSELQPSFHLTVLYGCSTPTICPHLHQVAPQQLQSRIILNWSSIHLSFLSYSVLANRNPSKKYRKTITSSSFSLAQHTQIVPKFYSIYSLRNSPIQPFFPVPIPSPELRTCSFLPWPSPWFGSHPILPPIVARQWWAPYKNEITSFHCYKCLLWLTIFHRIKPLFLGITILDL